jgi:hypothetical protein
MERSLASLLAVTCLLPGLLLASPMAAATDTRAGVAASTGDALVYGHIRALTRRAGRFELRFDPAWWLTGLPAERAAVEDRAIAPGDPVPNDYYIVEEGHRLLTYVVRANARVLVLDSRLRPFEITVAELVQVRSGRNPTGRRLYDRGNHLGYWIRVGTTYPSPVLALEQQYQP